MNYSNLTKAERIAELRRQLYLIYAIRYWRPPSVEELCMGCMPDGDNKSQGLTPAEHKAVVQAIRDIGVSTERLEAHLHELGCAFRFEEGNEYIECLRGGEFLNAVAACMD